MTIDVKNEINNPNKNDKKYAAGIISLGDLLTSKVYFSEYINIKTEAAHGDAAAYGIYVSAGNGDTVSTDLHVVNVYAPEIVINSAAPVMNGPAHEVGHGAGVYVAGNIAPNKNEGKNAVDIGIDRDWGGLSGDDLQDLEKLENAIKKRAETVTIHGSDNAIFAEWPNTWVTVGANSGINLSSDNKSTVQAENGARITLYGNSAISARGNSYNASALLADNSYSGLPFANNKAPESRINLVKGNHNINGDITAVSGGRINIAEGTHAIAGDIHALGRLIQTAGSTAVYNAEVSIKNNGGFFTGKTDTFYKYESSGTHRTAEKEILEEYGIPNSIMTGAEAGIINLSFSNNADWYMTDRSFVTDLSLENSTVHLNHGRNGSEAGRGLFIEQLDLSYGKSGFFNMTLNGADKSKSDMLYVSGSTGAGNADYKINIDMMNSDLSALGHGEKIRYATVKGEDLKNALAHRVVSYGSGIYNIEFETGYAEYDTADTENEKYNGSGTDLHKPGNSFVNDEFGGGDSYNLYLEKVNKGGSGTFSRSAHSIFDLSRFGYLQIIQPDRLNKRVGDVFNLGSEEDGLWFRTNYDDLGIEGIRSESVALQGGYDKLYRYDEFSFRYGLSGRYTKSDLSFAAFEGYGEIQATQLSLYVTYVSKNDWFLDVTGRYGYIVNESHLKTESGFDFASSYDNWFQGVSVEAGKRFYLYDGKEHDFYFAPQALLTYLHINEVDYTTNQDSHIAISDINSLISRLGAKLGYVYDETYQIALKWDWFREWNGEQHFAMTDRTTGAVPAVYDMGTDVSWYDVGLTLQANPKENFAVYFDAERLYGGFYQNSWRFSAGMRITF